MSQVKAKSRNTHGFQLESERGGPPLSTGLPSVALATGSQPGWDTEGPPFEAWSEQWYMTVCPNTYSTHLTEPYHVSILPPITTGRVTRV